MFGIFKKNNPKPWDKLSLEQKKTVAKNISKIKNWAGPRYKIVTGTDILQRDQGISEFQNEDQILSMSRRGRMLDMARNAVRNSSTLNTILKSFDLHSVGTQGGKVILSFPDQILSDKVKDLFSDWTHNADFFDGINFNQLLRLILKTQILNGDCCLIFDDGIIEDSGRVLLYESDMIGCTSDEAIIKRYGKNCRQSNGRVYSPNGRFIGCVVSRSERGNDVFDPAKCYLLKRDPNLSDFYSSWIMPRNIWRPNQGRGISQLASALATITDLEDLLSFELAAAKKNSQTLATIVHDEKTPEATVPSTFDNDINFEAMTDEEINALSKQEVEDEQTISFDKIRGAGVVYEAMPANYKLELLDTKHPNSNIEAFIKFLAGRTAGVFGLSQHFADQQVTGADYQANFLYSKRAFEDTQKNLEQICDWVFYHFVKWSIKRGDLDYNEIFETPYFMKYVDWSWQKIQELDENAHEQANALKLKNMTGTYRDILGVDWKEKMEQIKEEIHWCEENKLPHPCFSLISGGTRPEVEKILNQDK